MENSAKAKIVPLGRPRSPHPFSGRKAVLPKNGEPVLRKETAPVCRVTFQGSIPLDGIRPDVCTVGVACLLRIIKPLLFLRGGVAVRYIWYNFGGTHKVWALVRAWP